jgi:hypothetical protein
MSKAAASEVELAMATLVRALRETSGGLMKLTTKRSDDSVICTVIVAVDDTAEEILDSVEHLESIWNATEDDDE